MFYRGGFPCCIQQIKGTNVSCMRRMDIIMRQMNDINTAWAFPAPMMKREDTRVYRTGRNASSTVGTQTLTEQRANGWLRFAVGQAYKFIRRRRSMYCFASGALTSVRARCN